MKNMTIEQYAKGRQTTSPMDYKTYFFNRQERSQAKENSGAHERKSHLLKATKRLKKTDKMANLSENRSSMSAQKKMRSVGKKNRQSPEKRLLASSKTSRAKERVYLSCALLNESKARNASEASTEPRDTCKKALHSGLEPTTRPQLHKAENFGSFPVMEKSHSQLMHTSMLAFTKTNKKQKLF